MPTNESALVTVQWLHDHLHDPGLVILDASVPPVVPGFEAINSDGILRVIPGAGRFDYDENVCKPNSSLPHMMPSAELFESEVRKLGVDQDSLVVVYDDAGLYASPRAWWMFRAMGLERVKILDGGLPAWLHEGFDVVDHYADDDQSGNFKAVEQPGLFCAAENVLAALDDDSIDILDARSAARFHGTAPEPRPGLRSGHMPGACNLPCRDVLAGLHLKPVPELQAILAERTHPGKSLITSCGSGITACILTLAAWEAGYRDLSVYDGSWVEWGQPSKLPVVTD